MGCGSTLNAKLNLVYIYRVRALIENLINLGTTLYLVVIDITHIVIQAVCNTIFFTQRSFCTTAPPVVAQPRCRT